MPFRQQPPSTPVTIWLAGDGATAAHPRGSDIDSVRIWGSTPPTLRVEVVKDLPDGWQVIHPIALVDGALEPVEKPTFRHANPQVRRACPKNIQREARVEDDLRDVVELVHDAIAGDVALRTAVRAEAEAEGRAWTERDQAAVERAATIAARLTALGLDDAIATRTRRGAPRRINASEAIGLRDEGWTYGQLAELYGAKRESVVNAVSRHRRRVRALPP